MVYGNYPDGFAHVGVVVDVRYSGGKVKASGFVSGLAFCTY